MSLHLNHSRIERMMAAANAEALKGSLVMMASALRVKLSQPGTGRIYRVAQGSPTGRNLRARGFHQASAPGFPPAAYTGRLRASWMLATLGARNEGFAYLKRMKSRMILRLQSNIHHARRMEYGDAFVKPRPYIRPLLPVFAQRIPQIFAVAFSRAFR